MAQYRLSIKCYHDAISRRIDYINREGKYKYGGKGEEYVGGWSDHLPSWAADCHDFWQVIEKSEKPGNVQARGFQLNLPVELSHDEHMKIVRELMDKYFKNNAYTVAFHTKPGNPHAHVLFNERKIDGRPEPGRNNYCKQRTGYSKDREITGLKRDQWLRKLRKGWEEIQNQALERAGCKERVSCETLKKQGIKRLPQVHLGPVAAALERRGIQTRRGDINRRIRAINEKLADYEKKIAAIYTEVDTYDMEIFNENSKISRLESENQSIRNEQEKQRIQKQQHQDSIWRFCNYFISDKAGIDDLCKRFDEKDFSGFVNLLANNFCNERKHTQINTKFTQEIILLESQHQMKLTDKEVSRCLTYKFWSLYGKGKESWKNKYDSYIMYLQYRRALGKVLNFRPKKEKELASYKKDLVKWDLNSKMFMPNGQNIFDEDVNLHEIIGTRLEETKKTLKEIKSDKDCIIKFEKNLELWKKQSLLTRNEIVKHNELSTQITKQKDDIIEIFSRLNVVSHDFYLEHEASILDLNNWNKMLESEENRVNKAIKTIEKAEKEQQLDKDCITTFEEKLNLWEKQSITSREEIEKHSNLSLELSKEKDQAVNAINRLQKTSYEFVKEHGERVLAFEKMMEDDSKRIADALDDIAKAEAAEEKRKRENAEQEAVQTRMRLATKAALESDKEAGKKKQKELDELQTESHLEKNQEPEIKAVDISTQSMPRRTIDVIHVFDNAISIARFGQPLEDYKASQIPELLNNYGLDIKEYSEQHPKETSYLQQIVDMSAKYQQDHPLVTTEKAKSEEGQVQKEDIPKQRAARREIKYVKWGASFRKDRPRVLFIQWGDKSQSYPYHAEKFDELFKNHSEDIKEYYARSDNKKYDFDRFCKDMKHEIEVWKGPQPQNDLSIPEPKKGRKVDGRGGKGSR